MKHFTVRLLAPAIIVFLATNASFADSIKKVRNECVPEKNDNDKYVCHIGILIYPPDGSTHKNCYPVVEFKETHISKQIDNVRWEVINKEGDQYVYKFKEILQPIYIDSYTLGNSDYDAPAHEGQERRFFVWHAKHRKKGNTEAYSIYLSRFKNGKYVDDCGVIDPIIAND